jgi:hypothetical protein
MGHYLVRTMLVGDNGGQSADFRHQNNDQRLRRRTLLK